MGPDALRCTRFRRVIKRHAMSRSFQRWRLLSGQKAVAEARLSASRRDRAQASALAAWAEIAELRRAARSAARAMKLSLAVRRSADAFSFWRTAARKRRAAVAMFSRWHTRCARQVRCCAADSSPSPAMIRLAKAATGHSKENGTCRKAARPQNQRRLHLGQTVLLCCVAGILILFEFAGNRGLAQKRVARNPGSAGRRCC